MRNFFDRFFFWRRKKEEDNSSILYFDEKGLAYSVTLICSCQEPLQITEIDESFEPAIPHFECKHCDRVCKERNCKTCLVYSKMTDARITIED